MDKHLHIVTHDVPWPANYGGVIDIFYTIKELFKQGVNIHLHCFTQGRPPQPELEKYCCCVYYYQRKNSLGSFSFKIPLIVNSRVSEPLIARLQMDDYPVLLEGIHCSYYLYNGALNNRKIIVRLFNTEFEYYKQLASNESNLFKKLYYLNESRLLKKFERTLAGKATILALSSQDVNIYRQFFNASDIHYLPVFIPYASVLSDDNKGSFCLYHGNLAINENEKAATWLLKHVFNKVEIPFVIAGKNPSKKLESFAHKHQNSCLVSNPSEKEMQDIIRKAHVHVLPSFNNTGIKLKLLNAFFNGRHCLVNQAGVAGSGLENYCTLAEDAASFLQKTKELYALPFTAQEIMQRQDLLKTIYNNEANARKLMTFLW